MSEELNVKPVSLWVKIRAQCLQTEMLQENPYVWLEGDTVMVKCPRCGHVAPDKDYIILSVMPAATQWSVPVRKCREERCSHLFSLIW